MHIPSRDVKFEYLRINRVWPHFKLVIARESMFVVASSAVTYTENTKRKTVTVFNHHVAGNSDRGAFVVAERTGQAHRVGGGNQGSSPVRSRDVLCGN